MKTKTKSIFTVLFICALIVGTIVFLGRGQHNGNNSQIAYSSLVDGYDMFVGTENDITITVSNNTSDAYNTANNDFLSYHIYTESGEEITEHGYDAYIDSQPGTTTDVSVCILAPEESGYYKISIDIYSHEGKWLSEDGLPTLEIPVHAMTEAEYGDIEEESRVNQEIEEQKIIDQNINQEIASGTYSIEEPLIEVNPYNNSPLTAIVGFTSEEDTKTSIHIAGKDKTSDVDYAFNEYGKDHIIPIYGLYADADNVVSITSYNKTGKSTTVTYNIKTEPLVSDLTKITLYATMNESLKYEPGFNFSFSSYMDKAYKMAFDANGDIRWYLTEARDSYEVTSYQNLNGILMAGVYSKKYIEEYNLLGRLKRAWYIGNDAHHELKYTNEGNILIAIDQAGEDTIEDGVMEIDYNSGEVLSYLDYRKIVQKTRDTMFDYSNTDWLHMNSIIEHGEDLIVSNNHQSSVVCNDREGNIKWILADPIGFLPPWSDYLLTPSGEGFEWPYNQHSLQLLPDQDGNPDTLDIMLFDNGTSRRYMEKADDMEGSFFDGYAPELYSRMVQYRINEKDMTVEQIWEYGKDIPELYSAWRSDANLLAGGTLLGTFCRQHYNQLTEETFYDTAYVEVDRDKNVIWSCVGSAMDATNNYWDYRCERIPIYSGATEDLSIGDETELIKLNY